MYKKILNLVLLVLMLFSLAACFHDEDGDVDDHGDTPISATIINTGVDVGTINSSTDIDMFSVVCGNGLATTCSISAQTTGSTDTVGRILNIDGSQVASNDDGGAAIPGIIGANFSVSASGLQGGRIYYIEVTGFSTVTGDYVLSVIEQ